MDAQEIDPDNPKAFETCKLDFEERKTHASVYALHEELLRLRRDDEVFSAQDRDRMHGAIIGPEAFLVRFGTGTGRDRLVIVNLGHELEIAGIAEPPDKFVFVDAGGRRVHLAHVVWRSGAEVGVQFLQTERIGPRAGGAAGALDIARRFAANLPPEILQ